eukprot:CAMPEP_0178916626 /NCGR_PEP_ID=MMETSP0786-20121207/12760_1 /TAXON_ID=186022 /ORGANISM="Thalassionema frauenfeldii, Strain CCMP 1798" /LENGTH=236 /DNA_ID=CAMNT_0020590015 /DNA_START=212 /DNA_END=925 /DNA_ORIENTATION=-
MTITEYPNPVLRQLGRDIEATEFGTPTFCKLCDEMISIMYQASGVGLAAPQVGLALRLFVYNPTGDAKNSDLERVVVNPKILDYSDDVELEDEGCLSSRSGQCQGCVCRASSIMVEYVNHLNGAKIRKKLKGFEARVFQHEYDHIEGILHFDRFCPEDRETIQPQLDALIADYSKDDAILEPDAARQAELQPMPLPRKGWLPPQMQAAVQNTQTKVNKKLKKGKSGGGGFGGGFGK